MIRRRPLWTATVVLVVFAAAAALASDDPPEAPRTPPTQPDATPPRPPIRAPSRSETERNGILMRAPKPGPGGFVGDPYPFDTCVVDDAKLGAGAVTIVMTDTTPLLEGRQLKFCCAACATKFRAQQWNYLTKLDDAIKTAQIPSYPIDHCIVMIEHKLDATAESVVYGNRLYRFCCLKCVNNFDKNLDRYVTVYEKEITTKQKNKYPIDTCIVTGATLPKKPFDLVVHDRLVRVADEAAAKKFYEKPSEYLAKLDEARKAKSDAPKATPQPR